MTQRNSRRYSSFLVRTYNWDSDSPTKNRETLVRSVVWHLEHYQEDPAKTIILANGKPAIELSFRMPTNIKINFESKYPLEETTYLGCGHLDRLCEFAGAAYAMDRKTTDKTVGSYYFDQYNPDNQMSLYTAAAQVVYNIPAQGVLVDAVQTARWLLQAGTGPDPQVTRRHVRVASRSRSTGSAWQKHLPSTSTGL